MNNKEIDINKMISYYIKPAIGCTEPAAIALSTACALSAIKNIIPSFINPTLRTEHIDSMDLSIDDITSIELEIDTNVIKNAFYVSIPSTNQQRGIDFASIIGLFSNPDKELALLESIKESPEVLLKTIENKGLLKKFSLKQWKGKGIHIKALLRFKDGTTAEALIEGNHSNITLIKVNDSVLFKATHNANQDEFDLEDLKDLKTKDMIYLIKNNLSEETRELLWRSTFINMKVAQLGLESKFGDGIGFVHKQMGALFGCIERRIVAYTAAATDVRMAGHNINVMSSVGSGNQGLIIVVSLTALAENYYKKEIKDFEEKEKEHLIKSIALAHLVTAYTTAYTGILSNLCGCLCKAGLGSAAGMGYFLYYFKNIGQHKNLNIDTVVLNSIKNMIACNCGVLCDGAKGSCANKAKSGAFNAFTSANEAIMGAVGTGGIPGKSDTEIDTIMKNFVETFVDKFGQPTDLHIVDYLVNSNC